MKKIILTGGGTAGHVTPNIALLPKLIEKGYEITYIGSKAGMEKELIENCKIPYYGISSGKLRRYLDIQNVKDIFKVIKGIGEAKKIIKKNKPDVIFSKGGFVSVPVVIGGWMNKVPVIIHESDMTPGLANRISIPFSKKVCASFPETMKNIPKEKGVLTGTPIRQELFEGIRDKGLLICGFSGEKPILLVMGGSSGSVKINNCLKEALPQLLEKFLVVHICGKGNLEETILKGYKQFEYLNSELTHIFACSDIILSRAGANSITEFLALQKPCLLVPLSKNASRGDQILNAESFKKQGFSDVLEEENMNKSILVKKINDLYQSRESYMQKMRESKTTVAIDEVMKLIEGYSS